MRIPSRAVNGSAGTPASDGSRGSPAHLAAVLLLLAGASQAQEAPPREVYQVLDGYVRTVDAGTVQVHGGAYLPSETLLETSKELASLRAENSALKASPAPEVAPPGVYLVVALVVGVLLGGGAALFALKH